VTTYRVDLSKRAVKELGALAPPVRAQLVAAIQGRAADPRPATGVKRLKGYEDQAFRLRVGDYRVIYKVDDAVRVVAVVRIGHRREVYR
jgi:mRNA interferase RelE/StbE